VTDVRVSSDERSGSQGQDGRIEPPDVRLQLVGGEAAEVLGVSRAEVGLVVGERERCRKRGALRHTLGHGRSTGSVPTAAAVRG